MLRLSSQATSTNSLRNTDNSGFHEIWNEAIDPSSPQAPHLLLLELQRMKPESYLQVWIVKSDGLGILRVDLKGLEQGPVFNVVSILRAVVDSRGAVVEDDP